MKFTSPLCVVVFIICLALACNLTLRAAEQTQKRHRFVCIDNKRNNLILVDQFKPQRSWTRQIPAGSRDIQILDKSTLLVSHGNGAAEYDMCTGTPLTWKVDMYRGIQSARRLQNGNTLLASILGVIYTVGPTGEEIDKNTIKKSKLDLRLVRLLENGNLLIGAKSPSAVLETKITGELVRTLPLPGKGYKALQLDNGHILASTGDEVKVVEMDKTGKIVSFVGGKDVHSDLGLDFCSGWDILKNGNIVMVNWLGHGKHGTAPHLVEFSRDNKVAWKWEDHKIAAQVTNVKVLK